MNIEHTLRTPYAGQTISKKGVTYYHVKELLGGNSHLYKTYVAKRINEIMEAAEKALTKALGEPNRSMKSEACYFYSAIGKVRLSHHDRFAFDAVADILFFIPANYKGEDVEPVIEVRVWNGERTLGLRFTESELLAFIAKMPRPGFWSRIPATENV